MGPPCPSALQAGRYAVARSLWVSSAHRVGASATRAATPRTVASARPPRRCAACTQRYSSLPRRTLVVASVARSAAATRMRGARMRRSRSEVLHRDLLELKWLLKDVVPIVQPLVLTAWESEQQLPETWKG